MEAPHTYKNIEKLDAMRGFSALYVLFFHMLPQKIFVFGINIGFLFRFGSEAVILFFILSGFVIKYSWEKSKDTSFRTYFFRRFIRIYIPLFFIFLLGYLLKCHAEGAFADPEWTTLLGNLFMLQDVISLKPNVISAPYLGNGLLWSLSYEWWFYMLFFLFSKHVPEKKVTLWVNSVVLIAALSYLIYPFIVNRIVMYFAIWWTGVQFATIYLREGKFTFNAIRVHASVLGIIIVVLGLNLYLNFSFTKVYKYPLVSYPFIELRHFLCAFLLLFGGIIWNKCNWFGFNQLFGIFKYAAPISYVIYIAHHYLVVEATYLDFLDSKIVEYTLYVFFLLAFSYLIEVVIYSKIKNRLVKSFLNQPQKK